MIYCILLERMNVKQYGGEVRCVCFLSFLTEKEALQKTGFLLAGRFAFYVVLIKTFKLQSLVMLQSFNNATTCRVYYQQCKKKTEMSCLS